MDNHGHHHHERRSTMTKTFSASYREDAFMRDSNISRRPLLDGAAGAAAAVGLAACGAGSEGTPGGAQCAPGGGGAEGYYGPKLELGFCNGLIGGYSPFAQKVC